MMHCEPEYRRRAREKATHDQERADRERDEANKEANQDKIIAALQAIAIEQARAEDTCAPKNKRETWLKLAEIIALAIAAAVGAVAVLVGNHDASEQRLVMNRQLTEMQTQSVILRAQIKAVLKLTGKRVPVPEGWKVEYAWENIGKSDATNMQWWQNMAVIPLSDNTTENNERVHKYDFTSKPETAAAQGSGITITSNDKIISPDQTITLQQGHDVADGKILIVFYGYAEYTDIFGAFYTVRYCHAVNFQSNGNRIDMTLPIILDLPCEKRTEKPHP
jgi:hypothetical protein